MANFPTMNVKVLAKELTTHADRLEAQAKAARAAAALLNGSAVANRQELPVTGEEGP